MRQRPACAAGFRFPEIGGFLYACAQNGQTVCENVRKIHAKGGPAVSRLPRRRGRLHLPARCLPLCLGLALCLLCVSSCRERPFPPARPIHVFTREEGSGTRTAFEELFGLLETDPDGGRLSLTRREAVVARSNGVVLSGVSTDPAAIGYLSLGSLNSAVRALPIDGELPTAEAVRTGRYPAARRFYLVTRDGLSGPAADFLRFVFSQEGQRVVAQAGYVPVCNGEPFVPGDVQGKTVLVGSSSVSPVMEQLRDAYLAGNPGADIEIQTSDSASGIRSAAGGGCDFGMVSRELSADELALGLTATAVALDGIAVVVHPENTVPGLSSAQVRGIYLGQAAVWRDAGAVP